MLSVVQYLSFNILNKVCLLVTYTTAVIVYRFMILIDLFVCFCFFAVSGSEEQQLMLQWFKLVNRKNALIRYESELVIQ